MEGLLGKKPEEVLSELRSKCDEIRALVRTQYPPALIGYFWNMMFLQLFQKADDSADQIGLVAGPDEKDLLFAMEYIHAVIASDGLDNPEFANVDTEVGDKIIELSSEALGLCFAFGLVNSKDELLIPEYENQKLAFEILSNWVMIRGKRYQVLEGEFFSYALAPHDEVLTELYGIDSSVIGIEIQKIADASRVGVQRSAEELHALMEEFQSLADAPDKSSPELLPKLLEEHPELSERVGGAIRDLFIGGTFNISKETDLPAKFLADLSFKPGEADKFFDEGEFSGTPFKTLPARIKPLIAIGDEYYCTEPNFIRDTSYRAVQRAIIAAKPEYREEWNSKQKSLSEAAFPEVMKSHLSGAQVLGEIFYPLPDGQWAETDCLIVIDDVLISLECKAGVEALNPPAENMKGHLKNVERLLLSAYRQCSRFLDYLYSEDTVTLFRKKVGGGYEEIRSISHRDFRNIFPIGLTLESYTPFSSSIKELSEVVPIAGRHSFFALSMDDLMAMRYILASTGEFLHYLEVRQSVAGMKEVSLFDEMDHLGAYVSNNRFDQTAKEMMDKESVDFIAMDGFDVDVIGPFFSDPDFPMGEPRRQTYPDRLLELFGVLEATGAHHWLTGDNFLRNMGGETRTLFQEHFERTLPALGSRDFTFFATGGEAGAVFFIERSDGVDRQHLVMEKAQALLVAMDESRSLLFRIQVNQRGEMTQARTMVIAKPTVVQTNYHRIQEAAEKLRTKVKPL